MGKDPLLLSSTLDETSKKQTPKAPPPQSQHQRGAHVIERVVRDKVVKAVLLGFCRMSRKVWSLRLVDANWNKVKQFMKNK
jgi:hypothetical protein